MAEDNWQERTLLLYGEPSISLLKKAHVFVVGLGGVGGSAVEHLVRSGIGNISICDSDKIQASNRNRQIIALKSNEGAYKVDAFTKRLKDINPDLNLKSYNEFLTHENMENYIDSSMSYVLDAIDSVNPKIALIEHCLKNNIPIISSMGAGGKKNPALVKVVDFSETFNDKLARTLRKRFHRRGIYSGFDVVFSPEIHDKSSEMQVVGERNKKTTLGTISYMPSIFGLYAAAQIVHKIIHKDFY